MPCTSSPVTVSQHVTKRQLARGRNVNINACSSCPRTWYIVLLLVIASCVHVIMYHFLTSEFISSTYTTYDQIQQSLPVAIKHRHISVLKANTTTPTPPRIPSTSTETPTSTSTLTSTSTATSTSTSISTATSTSTETSISIRSSSLATWLNDIPKPKSSRNYTLNPVVIRLSPDFDWDTCPVPCQYRSNPVTADVNWNGDVVATMESAIYQPNTDVDVAHRAGAKYVLTPRLSSDVPYPYFSWPEFKILDTTGVDMIPSRYGVNNNTGSIAIAVISNCAGSSFRLAAITKLEEHGVSIAKYGGCFGQTLVGHKIPTLQKYLFTLAFENSIDEDYVTEKFWQPIEAGSIPVVIGTPTIYDFAPRRDRSILYISSMEDIPRIAKQMLYLSTNLTAYREYLDWKSGPDRRFLSVVDLPSVHSNCRLCIRFATDVTYRDASLSYQQSQCWNNNYRRLFIRERNRFDFYPLVIDINTFDFNNNIHNNNNNTNHNLNIFYNMVTQLLLSKHPHPIWYPRKFFPDHQSFVMDHNTGQQNPIFQFYSIYPAFVSTSPSMSNEGDHTSTSQRQITQREALFGPHAIDTELELKTLLYSDYCPYLEVIFV